MSIVESRWKEELCRHEDGIYFAEDEFVELCGTPDEGYRADSRTPISALLHSKPDGWTDLNEICSAGQGNYKVIAGSTSWEGGGFIAPERLSPRGLVWLLHLSDSEQFTEVIVEDSFVRAISDEYPRCFEWRIPIDAPEALTVTRRDDYD